MNPRLISFDCYGTLIDWESGISDTLLPLLQAGNPSVSRESLLKAYGEVEPRIQRGGYLAYSEVLREATRRLAARFAVKLAAGEENRLVESLPDWPAFPDTAAALRALSARFRLAILSNIDDLLLARSLQHLDVQFDWLITAEQVKAYKPAPAHFHELLRRAGVSAHACLHAAQSRYHDIRPARALGFQTAWINRHADGRGGDATLPAEARADVELPDLASLARALTTDHRDGSPFPFSDSMGEGR